MSDDVGPLSVLVVTLRYPPHHLGGYEVSCADVCERLASRGHRITVLTGDEREPGVADPDGEAGAAAWAAGRPRVLRTLPTWFRRGVPTGARTAADRGPGLRRTVRVGRAADAAWAAALDLSAPDVLSPWHLGATALGSLRLVAERGTPVVFGLSDEWPTYAEAQDPWARRLARVRRGPGGPAVVAGLDAVARRTGALPRVPLDDPGLLGPGLFISDDNRRRVRLGPWSIDGEVVHSGVDARWLGPPRTDGGRRPWQGHLLYVGRIDERKGIATAVEALRHLPGAWLDVQAPAGSGRAGDAGVRWLEELAARHEVADRVEVEVGDRDRLGDRYCAADVLLFPSTWPEPFGLVPLEAMAVGTPVIGTGVAGSSGHLLDGVTCLRHAPGDAASLAACVRRLADDPDLRADLVAGGLEAAAALDGERLADLYEAWLDHAARPGPAGPPATRAVTIRGVALGSQPPAQAVDALANHHEHATAVLGDDAEAAARRDPSAVKALYVRLGDDLLAEHADAAPSAVPVLSYAATHPVVVEAVGGRTGPVLDAGCGPHPAVAMALAAAGPADRRVVVCDLGVGTVQLAVRIAGEAGVRLVGVACDVERLPFRTGAFAAVVCDDVIEHVPDDRACAAELSRVCATDGVVVVATPNRWHLYVLVRRARDVLAGRRQPARAYFSSLSHLREYTWAEAERVVGGAVEVTGEGRRPVGFTAVDGSVSWKARLTSALVRRPPFHRLSSMVVLAGRPRRR